MMGQVRRWRFYTLIGMIWALTACVQSTATNDPVAIYTAAAETVAAQYTRAAGATAVAELTRLAQRPSGQPPRPQQQVQTPLSSTRPVSSVALPSLSMPGGTQPTATPLPTEPPPTSTPTEPPPSPTPTATPVPPSPTLPPPPPYVPISPTLPPNSFPVPYVPAQSPVMPSSLCDRAQFVRDVTIPDGTLVNAGSAFTKVWELRNVGTCPWEYGYALVFAGGDLMSAPPTSLLPKIVSQGETTWVSLNFTAPTTPGDYSSSWLLRNAGGQLFGAGATGSQPFWVRVSVPAGGQAASIAFDFMTNYCSASWKSSAGNLSCGASGNEGSVYILSQPVLEDGLSHRQSGLFLRPEHRQGGWIQGEYPAYTVKSGDYVHAQVGCLQGSLKCNVTFGIDARDANGNVRNLGEWGKVYEGGLSNIEVDLSPYSGQSLKLILRVNSDSQSLQDDLVWLEPSIRNRGYVYGPDQRLGWIQSYLSLWRLPRVQDH